MLRILLQRHPSFKVEAELELLLLPHCRKSVITFWHRRWHLTSGDSRDPRRRKTSLSIHVLFMSLIVTCIITVAQESIQLNKPHNHTCIHTHHLVIFYAFWYITIIIFCHNLYVIILFSVCQFCACSTFMEILISFMIWVFCFPPYILFISCRLCVTFAIFMFYLWENK